VTADEKTFGAEHPNVAQSLNNLADIYGTEGKYAEAATVYERSLRILENALGPAHPDVASVLLDYAGVLRKTNRTAEAEKLEARAKAIRAMRRQK
jgi:tetratricopeptide (TPR) repeat protein